MNAATGRQPLDGRLLLSFPFASEHVCRELQAPPWIAEALDPFWEEDVARGREACAAGLQAHPSNTSLRAMDASLALLDGGYREAREAFLALEAAADTNKAIDPAARAILWNNIAWADVRLADPGLLEEADAFSRRALEALSKNLSVMATRGTVLAALGRDEEARRLLVSALALHTSPRNQAFNWAVLATVDARAGHVLEAQKHYDAARSSWAGCDMLKEAEQSLAAAGALQPNLKAASTGPRPR
jgi:tetratricopeptide (TPR) repeat protein